MGEDEPRPALSPVQSLLHSLIGIIDRSLKTNTYLYETDRFLQELLKKLMWYENILVALHASRRYRAHEQLSAVIAGVFLDPELRVIENIKGLCEGTTDTIPFELAAYVNYEFFRMCDKTGILDGQRGMAGRDGEKERGEEQLGEGADAEPEDASGDKDEPVPPLVDAEQGGTSGETDDGASNEPNKSDDEPVRDVRGGIALCPFRQFNFTYEDVSRSFADSFKAVEDELAAYVDDLESEGADLGESSGFPPNLAMIAFQYAMGDDAFYHSFLFHELGHHVFSLAHKEEYGGRLFDVLCRRPDVPAALLASARDDEERGAFEAALKDRQRLPWVARDYRERPLLQWAGELFADAFAIALGGPQYALAFHELIGSTPPETTFGKRHPANLFRRQQQWHAMQKLEWTLGSDVGSQEGDSSPDEERGFPATEFASTVGKILGRLDPGGAAGGPGFAFAPRAWREEQKLILLEIVAVLEAERPRITEDAIRCVGDAGGRAVEFHRLASHVAAMFDNAIVPSTVVLDREEMGGMRGEPIDALLGTKSQPRVRSWVYRPQPCTVMNVARLIYEAGCGELLERWPEPEGLEGRELEEKKARLFIVHSRISDWAQKAVADWLMTRKKKR